jgi:putative ABC transport system substrate-binding protein
MISRRRFVLALGGVLGAPMAAVGAPPAKMHRVAFLSSSPTTGGGARLAALSAGLRELGYVEGRNLTLEARWPEGRDRRMRDVAQEIIDQRFELVVAQGNGAIAGLTRVLKTQKADIPIVMASGLDPVVNGFVTSFERPQSNITGLAGAIGDVAPQQVKLLAELVPDLSRIAVLTHQTNYSLIYRVTTAAQAAGISTLPHVAQTPADIDAAIEAIAQARIQAVVVGFDFDLKEATAQITERARTYKLATIFAAREQCAGGGLLSYGENISATYRRAAGYVDKIFKGAAAARLPLTQVKRDFAINRKTAVAVGIKIPAALLAKADKVFD